MPGRRILVHGGGRTATSIAGKLGIETKMAEGRRITDEAMLEVVTMVYGGLVNKNIVAGLQAVGVNAIGLTGADANIIRAHKRPVKGGVDYGFVGDVDAADGQMIPPPCTRILRPGMAAKSVSRRLSAVASSTTAPPTLTTVIVVLLAFIIYSR